MLSARISVTASTCGAKAELWSTSRAQISSHLQAKSNQGELILNFRVYLLASLSDIISKCLSTNAGVTQPFKNVCRST